MNIGNVYSGQCPNGDCGRELSYDRSLGKFDCPYCGHPVSSDTLLSERVDSEPGAKKLPLSDLAADSERPSGSPDGQKSLSKERQVFGSRAVFLGAILAIICDRGGTWAFSHLLHQDIPYLYNKPLYLIEPIVLLWILFCSASFGGTLAAASSERNRVQHASVVGLVLIATLIILNDDSTFPIWIQCIVALGGAIFEPLIRNAKSLNLGPLMPFFSWGVFSKMFGFSGFAAVYLCWQAPSKSFSEILRSSLLSGFFLALAGLARLVEQITVQRDRDLNAIRIAGDAIRHNANMRDRQPVRQVTGPEPTTESPSQGQYPEDPFFLYLRPFETTGKLNSPNPEHADGPVTPRAYMQPKSVEFESRIATAIESLGPFIALGMPGEHYGAGRVLSTEGLWKEHFKNLAKGAKAIFVIPLNAPGTQWEIDWLILSGMLTKCIFIMPPRPLGDFVGMAKKWAEASEILLEKGVSLPPYAAMGALFRVGNNGEASTLENLGQISNRQLRNRLVALVDNSHQRNFPRINRIARVLIAIVAMVMIVWMSVKWAPTVSYKQSSTSEGGPSPMRPSQNIHLPEGGGIAANQYRLAKYGLDFSLPNSWRTEDAATAERSKRAAWPVEDRERLERESKAIESRALFLAAAADGGASFLVTSEIQKVGMKAFDYAKSNEYGFAISGISIDGEATSHLINGQLFARIAISMPSTEFTLRTIEESTVCNGHLVSFIVSGSDLVDLQEAIDSLKSIRFANCE